MVKGKTSLWRYMDWPKKKKKNKYLQVYFYCNEMLSYECMLLLSPTSQVALVLKNPIPSVGDTGAWV